MKISSRPWRLLILGGLLVVLSCGAALWLLGGAQVRFHQVESRRQLLLLARTLQALSPTDASDRIPDVPPDVLRVLAADGIQLSWLDPAVVAGAPGDIAPAASALWDAPEVRLALQPDREWGEAVRPIGPDGIPHIAVALRGRSAESRTKLIWVARPQWTLAANPGELAQLIAAIGAIAAALTIVMVLVYLRLRGGVLRRVILSVRDLSSGDPGEALQLPDEDEFAALSASLNVLRSRITGQLELIDRQRRMLQSLVDSLAEGVIVVRHDGRIALMNPTAARLLGLGSDGAGGFVGQPVESCIPQNPLQRLLLGAQPRPALAGPPSDHPSAPDIRHDGDTRVEIETENGTVHLLARAAEVILAEAGSSTAAAPRGRVLMLTDITDLQRIIQMRTDFVANASHELRTPLATIRAAVETLLTMDLAAEAPAARAFLEKIDRHSIRLELMVADLLDLSRLETPTERFDPEPIDLRRLLDDIHARFAERLERKRLRWEVIRIPPESWMVHLNPHLLRLTLDNLVDNATKFTDPGGLVRLSVRISPTEVAFEVADTGCGIPIEDQQRVFERFYQVQRARSGPERGTGLGLSIVRHAVGALRGSIRLTSTPGAGTTVSVTVPNAA